MPEEIVKSEIDKAAGNNRIEGHEVTTAEKDLILKILNEYKGNYGEQAIDSLLYGLAIGMKDKESEKTHGTYKK